MTKRIRIVVVDDHALFRKGLVGLLSEMPDFQIAGEAANGREALEVIRTTKPDLVLMDVNMPVMDGIQAVQTLREQKNAVPILILTISQQDADLLNALSAGANGYLLKNSEPEELRQAIFAVAEGKSVLSPDVTGTVIKALNHVQAYNKGDILSERELEVLQSLAKGMTTVQIGLELFISENTVKTHIRHILEKLDAANRTEAVTKAIQMGLIQPEA